MSQAVNDALRDALCCIHLAAAAGQAVTLVLVCGFLAGILGGFVGHLMFDWSHEKWLQRQYKRRACVVDAQGYLHFVPRLSQERRRPPEHEFRTAKSGCGDPECAWCNANMRSVARRTHRGGLS